LDEVDFVAELQDQLLLVLRVCLLIFSRLLQRYQRLPHSALPRVPHYLLPNLLSHLLHVLWSVGGG
jgi:hypothetical protein